MNAKPLFVLLVGLNLVLAGALVWALKRSRPAPAATGELAVADSTTASTTAPANLMLPATDQKFSWNTVESEDYKKYIANPRAIGCPEETIRDIITADVNKLYESKRKDLAGPKKKFEFWKPGAMMGAAIDPERTEKERALNKEKPPPIPCIRPWYQHRDMLEMEIHIHLAYPSALQPDKWPRESAGPIAQVSEFFAHHVKAEDMQNPKLTTVDYTGTWNRITPWLPWMLMDGAPGYIYYMGKFSSIKTPDMAPANVLKRVEERWPLYLTAPDKWVDPSLSSLENYARTQQPQPPKQKT